MLYIRYKPDTGGVTGWTPDEERADKMAAARPDEGTATLDMELPEGSEHGLTYDEATGTLTANPYQPTPEQLLFAQLDAGCNEQHTKGILAYNNWGSLTLAQKDTVLKGLLGCMLSVLKRLGYFAI